MHPARLSGLLPALPWPNGRDAWRASIGAAFGIAACAALVVLFPDENGLHPALIAPLGASAVLAFAVPNAPLAQPWSAVAGNSLSALIAVLVLSLYAGPWAPPLVVGLAVLGMMFARALHPPGGAVALLAALDPAPVIEAGPAFAIVPVGVMTAMLVGAAIVFNTLTGRAYPFRQAGDQTAATDPVRLGLSEEDLTALIAEYRQSPNIGVADLGRLLAAAEQEAANHRFDSVTCGDVMTADLITVPPEADVETVAATFSTHRIKSLPVVDASGAFVGIILQSDIVNALIAPRARLLIVGQGLRPNARRMARAPDRTTETDTPVGQVLNRLAANGAETIPVMREGRLAGIITRSDIMRLLLSGAGKRQIA